MGDGDEEDRLALSRALEQLADADGLTLDDSCNFKQVPALRGEFRLPSAAALGARQEPADGGG